MTLIVKNHPRKNIFRKNIVISIPYFIVSLKKLCDFILIFFHNSLIFKEIKKKFQKM